MIEQIKKRERYKKIANLIVCDYFNIDIKKPTRIREYVTARSMYYKVLRANTNMSFQEIANTFNKNHATVMHSIKQLDGIMEMDYSLRSDYLSINDRFVQAIDDLYESNLYNSDSEQIDFEAYRMLLSDYHELKTRHKALRVAHKQLVESNDKMNERFKKLKTIHEERERYYKRNGYVIR